MAYSNRVVVMADRRQIGELVGAEITAGAIMNAIAGPVAGRVEGARP